MRLSVDGSVGNMLNLKVGKYLFTSAINNAIVNTVTEECKVADVFKKEADKISLKENTWIYVMVIRKSL